jgi:hypothetical protein
MTTATLPPRAPDELTARAVAVTERITLGQTDTIQAELAQLPADELAALATILAGMAARPPRRRRNVKPCGTYAAWRRHLRAGDPFCFACDEAQRAYYRDLKRAKAIQELRESERAERLQGCGTRGAYRRHVDNGETPCAPCDSANRTYQRERKREQRAAAKKNAARTTALELLPALELAA